MKNGINKRDGERDKELEMEMEEFAKNAKRIREELDKLDKFYTWGDISHEEHKKKTDELIEEYWKLRTKIKERIKKESNKEEEERDETIDIKQQLKQLSKEIDHLEKYLKTEEFEKLERGEREKIQEQLVKKMEKIL